jgi:hypothetical protein
MAPMSAPMLALLLLVLLASMLLLLGIGHRLGSRRLGGETEQERVGLVSIETAVFGLLGLIFAFTYAGAANRFEARRALSIQEANAVGTAYLRLDLLTDAPKAALKEKLRRAGALQVAAYEALPDVAAFEAKLGQAKALQAEVWNGAVAAVREAPPPAAQLLLPALNDMIDVTSTRESLVRVHTPGVILAALVVLALFCSVLAGYGLAGSRMLSRYLHMGGFAFVITLTVYVVLDYDHPRFGLIRVDFADSALAATVAAMK